jgi:hypothetical protein
VTEEELAALTVALEVLRPAPAPTEASVASRWKRAARRPELELEDLRAL